MAIQPLRASSKKNRHHNSTGQHGIHIVWKPHLFHSTGCIASPARGRVWLTCHTVFVSLPKNHGNILRVYFIWSAVKFCHSLAINKTLPSHGSKMLRAVYSYIPEIQKQYGISTRPFRVPVMQYIRCCGRGVVPRLVFKNFKRPVYF